MGAEQGCAISGVGDQAPAWSVPVSRRDRLLTLYDLGRGVVSDRAGEVFAGDGVAIHYELVGHGPVVLLLHGVTSTYQDTWVKTGWVADLVRAGWSPLGIDVRGHGLSGKPLSAAAYTPDVLVADVLTVLTALGTRRVHAIGFSMGGGGAAQPREVIPTPPSTGSGGRCGRRRYSRSTGRRQPPCDRRRP